MVKRRLIPLSCVVVAVFIVVSLTESAQAKPQQVKPQQVVPPVYNPYPPGILPDDLESEIARVRREVNGIPFPSAVSRRDAPAPERREGD